MVILRIVEFSIIGIWLHMEHQSQLNLMIPQSNQFLPATWNVRMDAQDQNQISAMSVNTSEEVSAMNVLLIAQRQSSEIPVQSCANLVVLCVQLVMAQTHLTVCPATLPLLYTMVAV